MLFSPNLTMAVNDMIDKTLVTPLYTQVADQLRREIIARQYGDHGCIGTHTQLAERFGVSLRTIRAAALQLEQEGLVDIRQGKGTFVRGGMVVDRLRDLTGISQFLADLGVETEVAVPIFEQMDTPVWLDPDVREGLGPQCVYIRRIVVVSGRPVAEATMYLPGRFWGSFTKEEVEQRTVYQIYQKKLGIELGRGRQTIRAGGADQDLAVDLEVPPGSPLLQLRRRAYDAQGRLIEYMFLSYVADQYSFEVEMDLNKEL